MAERQSAKVKLLEDVRFVMQAGKIIKAPADAGGVSRSSIGARIPRE
jgi:hypothetical protein